MSTLRPNSVCDTTPLQRLESQSSGTTSEPSSPVINATAAGCVNQAATVNGAGGLLVKGISALANHNNNKIEITLNGFVSSTGDTNTNSTNTNTDTGNPKNMDSQGARQICDRIFWDVVMLGCVGLPILLFHLYGVPYKRGFFCNDETLKHPYRNSSIKTWMLYLVGVIVPIAIMMVVEFYRANADRVAFVNLTPQRHNIFSWELPVWLVECYKKVVPLLFGVAAGQLTTDVAKYSIGRLRPHFFAVCQPIMPDGSTCDDPINAGHYIEDFHCRAVNVTAKMLKEVRLSFPSGHSTFALFTMLYIVIYLQERVSQRFKMFTHLLQLVFLMLAWYTALSRVSDYKHHWSDVVGGASVGTMYALVVTRTLW